MGDPLHPLPIGLIFLNPLLGAGALSGKLTDIGTSNDFMEGLAESSKPGCSTLQRLGNTVRPFVSGWRVNRSAWSGRHQRPTLALAGWRTTSTLIPCC